MFKNFLQKYFAKIIYPTCDTDWYKRKNYIGSTHLQRFNDFVKKQKKKGALYYREFKLLRLRREFITSDGGKLDTVTLIPSKTLSKDKPGKGLYIICFQGKREYYESRFRDMAMLSRETGATVIGFNPKGLHSSSGKTKILADIIQDGIAVVKHLLAKNIESTQIIFYGNSLGAAVSHMVIEYFNELSSLNFRQINSNSFKSIAAIFATNLNMTFFEQQLYQLMWYAGWEIIYRQNYYQTGIYKCYLTRKNDKTIKPEASFASMVNLNRDIANAPTKYKKILQWLDDNSELVYLSSDKENPHNVSLHKMYLPILNKDKQNLTSWYFINKYLKETNKFINNKS